MRNKVFIVLLLNAYHKTIPRVMTSSALLASSSAQVYDWLEFFAGHAACTAWVRLRGFRGCKFDLKYADKANGHSSNYMDINSHSGFVLLGGDFVNNFLSVICMMFIEIA